jgi:phosphate transport system substrate-binding protein
MLIVQALLRRKSQMKRTTAIRAVLAVSAVGAAVAVSIPASASAGGGTLNGAGSSLVAPLVDTVFAPDFNSAGDGSVNFSSIGSSKGIAAITARSVDFGASDAPLTSAQASACGCDEIPWALSATGPAFHLAGIGSVNLSGPVLANIYLGTVTMWNDPSILALNKGKHLPPVKISVIFRSDGSGDTYVFTKYLSDISPTWASQVGFGTTVAFPVGTGGSGNSGVAALIDATNGALGYVSTFYVRNAGLSEATVENNSGVFVHPYVQDIAAAAALNTSITPNAEIPLVNPPGYVVPKVKKGHKAPKLTYKEALEQIAYPLSTYTYAIVPATGNKQLSLLQQFLTFAIGSSEQAKGAKLTFAPLPKAVVAADTTTIQGLK